MNKITIAERKQAYTLWQEHCKRIQQITDTISLKTETNSEKLSRINSLRKDYNAFCEYYFPHFLALRDKTSGKQIGTISNAKFHTQAANKIKNTQNLKAVFMWPRGHAKSTHIDIMTPLWLMFQEKPLISFMVLVGKSEDAAERLLSDIQAELQFNKLLIADFGAQSVVGNWTSGEFKTQNGINFLAVGRGQSPRGLRKREARPDYIVIDDLDDDELCRNPRRVREMVEWVNEALFGALDVGRGRFIMVGNLISKTSVLQEISQKKGVYLSKIKAIDGNGNPVWKEKWTKKEVEEYRNFVGFRAWEKEMMHNPINEGTIFKHTWIKYKKALKLKEYDEMVIYIDPSFKATTANDYKACRFWGRKGKEYHLIDCFVRQCTVGEMVSWLYDIYESSPEMCRVRIFMEANFMQDIIIDEFEREGVSRGYQLPVIPDKRKKPDKLQRIQAISPLWERGLVWYNEALKDSPDMQTGIQQTLAIEKGSHVNDDAPDADEGAIYQMQRNCRTQEFNAVFSKRQSSKNTW